MAKSRSALIRDKANQINKPVGKNIAQINGKTSPVDRGVKVKVKAGRITRKADVAIIQGNDKTIKRKPQFLVKAQMACPHKVQSLAGSNQFFCQVTCCDCGKALYMHYINETNMWMKSLCKIREEDLKPPKKRSRRSSAIIRDKVNNINKSVDETIAQINGKAKVKVKAG